ncbi:MAG: AAA family ATPase [Acidimicrobiales bacterium]
MTALDRLEAALAAHGCDPKRRGEHLDAKCPAHHDRVASLTADQKPGLAVVNCHAGGGCAAEDIVAAAGLTMSDLFDERPADDRPKIAATYAYRDEDGTALFEVVRFEPKDFRQRTPDGRGGWNWRLNGVRRVPYRLPELRAAGTAGGDVFVVEGEKDVEAVVREGEIATCSPGGAGKWRPEYADAFVGVAEAIIVADRDVAGYRHALDVARSLAPVVGSVLIGEPRHGKDVTDHLVAGLSLDDLGVPTFDELEQLCADSPEATVSPPAPAGDEPVPKMVAAPSRLKSGARFVLDDRADLEPIWGSGDEVLWASGEPLLIVGPTGVGKTTLGLQVLAARLGILDAVLGWPVKSADRPILYLAMDRPMQIRRAMRRLFGEQHRQLLDERLVIHEGPLPLDLGRVPEQMMETVQDAGAGSVFIDSLKDAAVKITDDEVGGNLNRAIQYAVRDGIEVVGLHHQRKGQGGAKPTTLEDVYGSTWITAGAGSVLLMWGAAGDPIVELRHLKQPASEVGPLKIETDHLLGLSTMFRGQVNALLVMRSSPNGITTAELARLMFESEKPNDNQRKKAQRSLERLVRDGLAHKAPYVAGADGGSIGARYHAVSDRAGATE